MTEPTPAVINLTPHDVVVVNRHGDLVHRFPASGMELRLLESSPQTPLGLVPGTYVPLWSKPARDLTNIDALPQAVLMHNAIIVSAICGDAMAMYPFPVYVPDTGPESVVRDDQGRIVGVRRLYRVNR